MLGAPNQAWDYQYACFLFKWMFWFEKWNILNKMLSLLLEILHAETTLLDMAVFHLQMADCFRCSLVQILRTREVMINDIDCCTCSISLIHQGIFQFFVKLVSTRKTCSFFLYFLSFISVVNHTWLFASSSIISFSFFSSYFFNHYFFFTISGI